ncbi:hypothetical protein NDU88_003906 [Pleurodeles waltl]|uniref:Uncharacterized protein n=1 Tax=Pleurodeles waltl TaxID=8319 RepID=A0AAV7NLZ9_PLEWA|nr:hypothetical protein NDU88_003906 [Pleurodeles waltl]
MILQGTLIPRGDAKWGIIRQTFLSTEDIAQPKSMAAPAAPPYPVTSTADPHKVDATDRILQEITAVGRRLDAMDLKISDLSAASTSILADIACFQEMVTDLDQRLTTIEDHIATLPELDAELRSVRAKITDLEVEGQCPFFWHTGTQGRL